MRHKIVAGNWKMNCNREEAFGLANEIRDMIADELHNDAIVIVAPPFVHLNAVVQIVKGTRIKVAAQNCSSQPYGAYTGEISASMIRSTGAEYVIIGHSERRTFFNETAEDLINKTMQALENGLSPIFCIGETLPDREAGNQESVVARQLDETLLHLNPNLLSKVILAYEPVWAIGTGKTATPAQAQEMQA